MTDRPAPPSDEEIVTTLLTQFIHDSNRHGIAKSLAKFLAAARPLIEAQVKAESGPMLISQQDGNVSIQWREKGVLLIIGADGSATYSVKADNPHGHYATGGVDFDLPSPIMAALAKGASDA